MIWKKPFAYLRCYRSLGQYASSYLLQAQVQASSIMYQEEAEKGSEANRQSKQKMDLRLETGGGGKAG